MYTYPYSDCPRLTVGIYHHDTMMCSATLPPQYTPVHQALPICHLAVSLETGHVDRTESIREQEINQLPGINSIHADLHCGDDQTHVKAGGSGATHGPRWQCADNHDDSNFYSAPKASFTSPVYVTANLSVYLSVCPSVTLRYGVKTTERRRMRSSPAGSPVSLAHSPFPTLFRPIH